MMYLRIDGVDRPVGVPPHLVAKAILDSFPDWMTGKVPAEGPQKLVKSGLKAILPLVLAMGREEMRKKGVEIPPADLRSKEAKENMIMYGVGYILSVGLSHVDGMHFNAATEPLPDGTLILLDVTPAAAQPAENRQIEPPRAAVG